MRYHLYTFYVQLDDPLVIRDRLLLDIPDSVIFDVDKLICKNQLEMALRRAERSQEQGTMIAKVWGIEVVLHLAATHQISEALELVGINSETTRIGIIAPNKIDDENIQEGISVNTNYRLVKRYRLTSDDPCSEIVTRGVAVVINHQ